MQYLALFFMLILSCSYAHAGRKFSGGSASSSAAGGSSASVSELKSCLKNTTAAMISTSRPRRKIVAFCAEAKDETQDLSVKNALKFLHSYFRSENPARMTSVKLQSLAPQTLGVIVHFQDDYTVSPEGFEVSGAQDSLLEKELNQLRDAENIFTTQVLEEGEIPEDLEPTVHHTHSLSGWSGEIFRNRIYSINRNPFTLRATLSLIESAIRRLNTAIETNAATGGAASSAPEALDIPSSPAREGLKPDTEELALLREYDTPELIRRAARKQAKTVAVPLYPYGGFDIKFPAESLPFLHQLRYFLIQTVMQFPAPRVYFRASGLKAAPLAGSKRPR